MRQRLRTLRLSLTKTGLHHRHAKQIQKNTKQIRTNAKNTNKYLQKQANTNTKKQNSYIQMQNKYKQTHSTNASQSLVYCLMAQDD